MPTIRYMMRSSMNINMEAAVLMSTTVQSLHNRKRKSLFKNNSSQFRFINVQAMTIMITIIVTIFTITNLSP